MKIRIGIMFASLRAFATDVPFHILFKGVSAIESHPLVDQYSPIEMQEVLFNVCKIIRENICEKGLETTPILKRNANVDRRHRFISKERD